METVREVARDLPVGGSRSGLVCPKCHGGPSGDRSFSVWRDEHGLGFKCHRAKCDNAGVRAAVPGPAGEPRTFTGRAYSHGSTTPFPAHFAWDLLRVPEAERTTLLGAKLGLGARNDFLRELVWAVRGYDYSARGHISRTYPDKFIRSWKTQDLPWHSFMGWERKPALWIVEDMMSAARIYLEGGNALALLGTHFSDAGREELKAYLKAYPSVRVTVALDPDATGLAEEMARELTFQTGRDTLFLPMTLDPKDMEPEELRGLIART